MTAERHKLICRNRKAYFEYTIDDLFEAGLVLKGTEVKSLRDGKAQLADAYAVVEGGEAYLYNLHIGLYDPGNRFNHDPTRKRKLLVHRKEIRRLTGQVERKGYTLIPLRIYFERGYAKVTIGVARGKREFDKRHAIAERDAARDVRRALRERHRSGA